MSVAAKDDYQGPRNAEVRPFSVANGRRQERVPWRMSVEVKARLTAGLFDTMDISANGCFVLTPKPAALNQLIQLLAYLPHGDRIEFVGRVAYVVEEVDETEGRPAGMGVEIFAIDRSQAPKWEAFVEEAMKEHRAERKAATKKALAERRTAIERPGIVPEPAQVRSPVDFAERRGRRKRRAANRRANLSPTEMRRLVRLLGQPEGDRILTVESARGIAVGTVVDLLCEHPSSFEAIDIAGQVVGEEPDGAHVRIAQLTSEDRRALVHFIVTGRSSEARRVERQSRPTLKKPRPA